jgi:enamine deaminase RidA (YjgF/YER057c/UK114 family)
VVGEAISDGPVQEQMSRHESPVHTTIGEHPMTRTLVPSDSPYAPIIGFSRAVRVGSFVSVGGTAPIGPDGKTVGVGDPAAQTRRCLETIRAALEEAGASLRDVVRTRMLLTRMEDWKEIAKVRGEYFKDILPVDTVMEINRFINPEWLVEIEVDAIVDEA